MKPFHGVLAVIALLFLVACASDTHTAGGASDRSGKLTASGYTEEGCLLNLKLTAREKSVRLMPDDVQVDRNFFMLLFPFLNHEGYQCSGSFTERAKRPPIKDSLYPID